MPTYRRTYSQHMSMARFSASAAVGSASSRTATVSVVCCSRQGTWGESSGQGVVETIWPAGTAQQVPSAGRCTAAPGGTVGAGVTDGLGVGAGSGELPSGPVSTSTNASTSATRTLAADTTAMV